MSKKVLTGTVVSDKMTNTIVVEIVRQIVHPLYKKRIKVSKKFSADTNGMVAAIGDVVKIEETRPISKTKYFKLVANLTNGGNGAKAEKKEEVKAETVEKKPKRTTRTKKEAAK